MYLACKYRKCPNDVLGLKWAEALKAAGPEKGPRQPGLPAIRDREIVYAILSRPLFRTTLAVLLVLIYSQDCCA